MFLNEMEIFFKNLRKNVRKELKWRNFLKMILIIPGHWVNKCPIFFQQESTYQKKKKIEKGKQRMKWIMLMMFVKKHFMMIEVCTTGWKFMSTRRAQQHVFKTIEIIFYWRGISTGWKNKSLSARQAGLLVFNTFYFP